MSAKTKYISKVVYVSQLSSRLDVTLRNLWSLMTEHVIPALSAKMLSQRSAVVSYIIKWVSYFRRTQFE